MKVTPTRCRIPDRGRCASCVGTECLNSHHGSDAAMIAYVANRPASHSSIQAWQDVSMGAHWTPYASSVRSPMAIPSPALTSPTPSAAPAALAVAVTLVPVASSTSIALPIKKVYRPQEILSTSSAELSGLPICHSWLNTGRCLKQATHSSVFARLIFFVAYNSGPPWAQVCSFRHRSVDVVAERKARRRTARAHSICTRDSCRPWFQG